MNIIVARTAGFCFGVGRADKLINELLSQGKKVCTWGPLIHNPGYIEELKKRGVLIAQDISRIPPGYTVVIRTHGISGSERKMLTDAGFEIADATCPFVSKIHRIVEENTRNGETLVIAGSAYEAAARVKVSFATALMNSGNCSYRRLFAKKN